jgi:hypothetical protein
MSLYCFGDSYTEGYRNDMRFPPYDAYRKSLGVDDPMDMPPIWSEILGEKLGVESFNYAKGGSSNHEILLKFCEQSSKLKKDDIVIINWTYIQRCLWVMSTEVSNDYKNHLTSTSPHNSEHYDPHKIYKNAYDIIAVNRTHFSWTYEVLRYQQLIDSLASSVGFRVYYWFTDDVLFKNLSKLESNLNQEKYIIHDLIEKYDSTKYEYNFCCIPFNIFKEYGAKTVYEESDGIADDNMHLGGTGHKVQSEIFYSYLTNTSYPKKLEKYLEKLKVL